MSDDNPLLDGLTGSAHTYVPKRKGRWTDWDLKVMSLFHQTPADWEKKHRESLAFIDSLRAGRKA